MKLCTKNFFTGGGRSKITCGKKHGDNEWMCVRCLIMYRLPKPKKELAIQRLAVILSEEDMKRVDHWRYGRSKEGPDFVLGHIGNAILTQEKFGALRDEQLLNDEIINASLHMYNTMCNVGDKRPSYCFTSFFYSSLAEQQGGYCYEYVRR